MVVLNGADGVNELLAKALTMGGAGLGLARQLLAGLNADAAHTAAGTGTGTGAASDGKASDNHLGVIEIK
jgi:hypothetical protein